VKTKPECEPRIVHPALAAARLGITTAGLVVLIRTYRYQFTELRPGGKPGDKGRNRWGLTEAQFDKILDGQRREFKPVETTEDQTRNGKSPYTPDGKSRLVRRRLIG